MPDAPRLVLYHKQRTSARLRFLRHAHGGVCLSGPLPADAQVYSGLCDGATPEGGRLHAHPGMLLRAAEGALGLTRGAIGPEAGFRSHVLSAGGCAEVHLASFTDLDPPIAAAEAVGARFIDLTGARELAAAELALLRLAYEHLLG